MWAKRTLWGLACGVVLGVALGAEGQSGETTPATTSPATSPDPLADHLSPEKRRERLVNHVTDEYARVLKSKLWMDRGLALLCLSRVPGDKATAMLTEVLQKDPLPMVRMVAWHCLVSRAKGLSEVQYREFCKMTWDLAEKDFFRGEMRVGLVRWLQVQPVDAKARALWRKLFAQTNSQAELEKQVTPPGGAVYMDSVVDESDAVVIVSLGQCLKAWHDAELMEYTIGRMLALDDVYRAEMVVRSAAEMDPTPGRGRAARQRAVPRPADTWWSLGSRDMVRNAAAEYAAWWREARAPWVADGAKAGATADWRALRSPYVPPMPVATVKEMDPDDPQWRRDLELGDPQIPSLNIGFVVDATGSMGRPMAQLRRGIKGLMDALSLVTREPGVAMTCYRDYGDEFVAKTVMPLAGPARVEELVSEFGKISAKGGGDEPEAVLAGLTESLRGGHWPAVARAKRVLILIGDAPPHPQEQEACEQVVKEAAAKGFKLYAVKTVTGLEAQDLAAFDKLAELGKGKAFVVTTPKSTPRQMQGGANANWAETAWLADQELRAGGEVPNGFTGVLTGVLADAINPQYADRVEPLVRLLLGAMTGNSPAEKRDPWEHYVPPPVFPGATVRPPGPQDR